jgi:hypothetical protein
MKNNFKKNNLKIGELITYRKYSIKKYGILMGKIMKGRPAKVKVSTYTGDRIISIKSTLVHRLTKEEFLEYTIKKLLNE